MSFTAPELWIPDTVVCSLNFDVDEDLTVDIFMSDLMASHRDISHISW